MNKPTRICPEAKTALIKWIEDSFNDIDEFIFTANMKNKTTMTIYDVRSYFNALAINAIQHEDIVDLARNDELIIKR